MVVSGVNVRESRFGRTRNLRDFLLLEVEDYSHTPNQMSLICIFCKPTIVRIIQVVEGENNIFVPKNGEWVDATTERFIYQV